MELETFTTTLVLVLCFVVYGGVEAAIEDRLKDDFFAIYTHAAMKLRDIKEEPVTQDKVTYYLFTRDRPQEYVTIDPSKPEMLVDKNATLVFLIHGWTENRERQWYEDLKNAFLTRTEKYHVVEVDWKEPADQIYAVSSYNTKDVGKIVGEFVVNLNRNWSVPLANILIVGHSLGGQVAGYVGKKVQELTGEKLPRIVALDPAGPLFISRPEEERLNKFDAEVVEVIHTDGGTFGFKQSCGTVDFYPNGGSSQPGCTRIDLLDISSVSDLILCDHHRSWELFIEAVLNPKELVALKCSSWAKFKVGLCDKEEAAVGDLKIEKTGEFYLETNRDKPFAKKRSGEGLNLLKIL